MDELGAHFLVGHVQHHAHHQSPASQLGDVAGALPQFLQLVHQVVPHQVGVLHQPLALHHVERGQRGGAGQVVAPEGGAQLPVDGREARRDEHGSHGEAVGDALGHGDDVGADAQPLVGEELAAAAVSALYLVADECRSRLLAGLAQPLGELGGEHAHASYALYALYDAGADIALPQLGLPGGQVVDGQEGDVLAVVDGGHYLGVVGHLHGQRRAPVEGLPDGQYPLAAVLEGGQLQGVLVGLRAGVDEEELVVVISACLSQPLGQLRLQGVDDGVAVEAQPLELLAYLLHVARVAVPYADDGVPAVEVQVFLSLVVPYLASFSLHHVDVVKGIYVE